MTRNTTSIKEIPDKKPEEPKKDVLQIATEETKSFFTTLSKENAFEPYLEFFTKSNANLSDLTYEQMIELWFAQYHNCWMNAAIQRAKIPAVIHKLWNGTEEQFLKLVTKGMLNISTEDIPHKTKSIAALMISMYKEHSIDFSKIEW